MDTIELILSVYGLIGAVTTIYEMIEEDSFWHGIACGILWPVFPLKAAVKVIIGLFK